MPLRVIVQWGTGLPVGGHDPLGGSSNVLPLHGDMRLEVKEAFDRAFQGFLVVLCFE